MRLACGWKKIRAVAYEANDKGSLPFARSSHLNSQFVLMTMSALFDLNQGSSHD